jgi:hypothetical protein
VRDKLIRLGEKLLAIAAAPCFALFRNNEKENLGLGVVTTIMFWPITIPALIIFTPIYFRYCDKHKDILNKKD